MSQHPQYDYSLFGATLRSDIAFPELEASPSGAPRWTVNARRRGEPRPPATLIREVTALPCTLRLLRTSSGFMLQHLCTGDYFVSPDGAHIEYEPLPGAQLDAVRFDILGRVIAMAMRLGGMLGLHGSGIAIERGVIGFFASKGSGKSTLASALIRAGGRLASDDLLVIDPGPPATVLPGVPRLRLRDDSFESIPLDLCSAERGPDGKHVVSRLPEERRMLSPGTLLALYQLEPVVPSPGGNAVERERFSTMAAAAMMASHGKNASILGQMETFDVLERAHSVARQVPVYRLAVSRELDRIGDVARQLIEWHSDRAR